MCYGDYALGRVVQVLKRRNPNLPADEPREILEASGIARRAHLLQVKGRCIFVR
jgi:hypothetical protein